VSILLGFVVVSMGIGAQYVRKGFSHIAKDRIVQEDIGHFDP
jgi:hypothetical protein